MEYIEYPVDLAAPTASKNLENINSDPKSLEQINKSSILKSVAEEEEDIFRDVMYVDKLHPEDATESNLDKKMMYLLELLEETINILEVEDITSTDSSVLLNHEDDESGYDYIICDHQKGPTPDDVVETEDLIDCTVVQENHPNEFGSECQAVQTNNSIITAKKNKNENSYELNEIIEVTGSPKQTPQMPEDLNGMENESNMKTLLEEGEGKSCNEILNDVDVAEFHAVMNSILEMLDVGELDLSGDNNCSATTSDQQYVRASDVIGHDGDGFIDFDNIDKQFHQV